MHPFECCESHVGQEQREVSCFPLFTFATKTANAAHAAHRRWRTGGELEKEMTM